MSPLSWKNLFKKSYLSIYISDTIEIGFNQYGPTIAIPGTLTAVGKVILIHNISLDLTKKGGLHVHQFDWFAFRPSQFQTSSFNNFDLTMASKFTIAPSHSHNFNILFSDRLQYSQINPTIKKIKKCWDQYLVSLENMEQEPFKAFIKQKNIQEDIDDIKNKSYWKAGEYKIKLIISTNKPKKKYEIIRSFFINDEQASFLTKNTHSIIADLCNQSDILYTFISPSLEMEE